MKSLEQIKPYSTEEAEEEASKMQQKINKSEPSKWDYDVAENKVEIEKAEKESKKVLVVLEKKARGEELSNNEENLIFEATQKAVQFAEGKLNTISYPPCSGGSGAYDPITKEGLSRQEERRRKINDLKNKYKYIPPIFQSAVNFVREKHQETEAIDSFTNTLEDYLNSADKYYENENAEWFNKYSLKLHFTLRNANEYLKTNPDDEKLLQLLEKVKVAEDRAYNSEFIYKKERREAGESLDSAYDDVDDYINKKNSSDDIEKFKKSCKELSEEEKLFLLGSIGANRKNGLKKGFARHNPKENIYEYHIGDTTTFMDSHVIMENLEEIGLDIDKHTQGGTSVNRKDIIKSLLSYMGLDDIRQMEEAKIEREKKEAKELNFQKELESQGFLNFIEKAGIKREDAEFIINYFRKNDSVPSFNMPSINDYLGSIKKTDNGEVVFSRQDFKTLAMGKNVIDNVETLVLIGKGSALLSSKIIDTRGFRTTQKGVFGYGPSGIDIKDVLREEDKINIKLAEKKDGKDIRNFDAKIEIGNNIFQNDPNFKKNEKLINKEIDTFFKEWKTDYDKRISIPRYADQKKMGKLGGTHIAQGMNTEGYRKGNAQVTGIEFTDVNKAHFRIYVDHEFSSSTQKKEKRIYNFSITLNEDGTTSIVSGSFETEKEYL
jgi:hypothetical protein